MQAVLQLLLDLCTDPASALDRIPAGSGLLLIATNAAGEIKSQSFPSPIKLSEYWSQLYSYAALLECCENFLSACKPSAPCLLCHPFGMCHFVGGCWMHFTKETNSGHFYFPPSVNVVRWYFTHLLCWLFWYHGWLLVQTALFSHIYKYLE